MISVIVTGGIATGKSAFVSRYRDAVPDCHVFDSDRCVHELLTTAEVVRLVVRDFGNGVLDEEGRVSRLKLRDIVFGDRDRRRLLEEMLHPRVRQRCREEQASVEIAGGVAAFLADVPLFYESRGFDIPHDEVVVVATSPAIQLGRLCERSRLTPDMAQKIIGSQMPLARKMERADRVVWNDGNRETLGIQASLIAASHLAFRPR